MQQTTSASVNVAQYNAWSACLYIEKQLAVRNELGLWNEHVSEEAVRQFVSNPSDLDAEPQKLLASSLLPSDTEASHAQELTQDFFVLGHLANEPYGSKAILYYAHHDHRSISIKILRNMMDFMTLAGVSKVLLCATCMMTRVNASVLNLEYEHIHLEFWSHDEMAFDWFGSRINHPMAVCLGSQCTHQQIPNSDGTACDQCRASMKHTLGALESSKYALPYIIPECVLARRFDMKDGDVLDSARLSGRFLRQYIAASSNSI